MIMKPGEIITKKGELKLNEDSKITKLKVSNSGDRPIQVGSHYHFFETNENLSVPHVGFNNLIKISKNFDLFKNVPESTNFYFVHSYKMDLKDFEISSIKGKNSELRLGGLISSAKL